MLPLLATSALLLADPAVQDAAPPPAKVQRSVLIVTLDTTRRDYMGFMGRSPSPTPMLDHLAKASVIFGDAVTSAPLTLPAHASLFTGLYPASHGVRDNSLARVPHEARTLAEILHEHGYATRAATSAFVLDPIFGLDQGFDRYRAPPRIVSRPGSQAKDELDARRMVDRALEDLRELAKPGAPPFLYWLHFFDPHFPYLPPDVQPLPPAVQADPLAAGKALYEAEIRFMDAEIGRLFGELHKLGQFEQLVVLVASDHGESLHDAPEGAHGFFLYDPTVRIPMFLRAPELAPQIVNVPVSLVDVTPTLLALLGIDAGGEKFDGVDLLPWLADPARPPPDRALMLESLFAWIDFGWAPAFGSTRGAVKYLRSAREELYDRMADPLERQNLFAEGEPRAEALGRELSRHLETASPLAADPSALSDADRARLQALGYAASGSSGGASLPADWRSLPDPLVKIAAMEKFNQVMLAVSAQNVERALALLRELVAEEPTSATMREQFALMLLNAGTEHVDEAVAELEAALKLDPRRARCWFALARCAEFQAEGERQSAKEMREQDKPKRARRHAEAEQAARERAESSLQKCLECEPDYPEALTMLSRTWYDRGERALVRGEKPAARDAYLEASRCIERLLTVLSPNIPEWTEVATARERVKRRLAELDAAK